MEKETEAGGRKQMEAFALKPWGKEEKLWERKPEPQSLPPPTVGRREMSCVKEGMCLGPTRASQNFKLFFVSEPCLAQHLKKCGYVMIKRKSHILINIIS